MDAADATFLAGFISVVGLCVTILIFVLKLSHRFSEIHEREKRVLQAHIDLLRDKITPASEVESFINMLKQQIRTSESEGREKDEKLKEAQEKIALLESQAATFDSTAQEILSDFEDLGVDSYDMTLARLYYEQAIAPKAPLLRANELVRNSLRKKFEEIRRKENSTSLEQEKKAK